MCIRDSLGCELLGLVQSELVQLAIGAHRVDQTEHQRRFGVYGFAQHQQLGRSTVAHELRQNQTGSRLGGEAQIDEWQLETRTRPGVDQVAICLLYTSRCV